MKRLEDYLKYEQPTKYIVDSDEYSDEYDTPVLTPGKSFILGYTNETNNIFPKDKLPVIIFDDFTTDCKYVDFPFKVKSSAMKILHPINNANAKFLYYFMTKIKFDNTLHKRYWISEYSQLPIKELNDNEQNEFVEKMQKLEVLIDTRNKQIENCNKLIKSQFVEMFGNIKTNDKKWNVYSNLLNYCVFNPKKNEIADVNKDTMVTFLPMQNVSVDGVINYSIEKKISEVWKGFTYFKENDVLFAKITPCMENGKGAVAKKLKNGIGFGTTEFHVIRPNKEINSVWLYHVLADKDFRKEAGENITGSAGQKRVPITFLENYKLAIPPIELQNKFAQIVEQIDKQKFVNLKIFQLLGEKLKK